MKDFQRNVITITLVLFFTFTLSSVFSQHYRGMAVLSDNKVWLSGSKGVVVRTTDGGYHWDTLSPKGYEKYDFRDIHVFNEKEIIVLASGKGGLLLKTKNGGKTWKEVYKDTNSNVFFDGMDFDGKMGKVVGDPIKNSKYNARENRNGTSEFIVLTSYNKGDLWEVEEFISCNYCYPDNNLYLPLENEALFAASGSSVIFKDMRLRIVTGGGAETRYLDGIYYSKPPVVSAIPIKNGPASGAYSFAILGSISVAVGGNYTRPNSSDSTAAWSADGGKTWLLSQKQPGGYRSCVAIHPTKNIVVCTGSNGSDFSTDKGQNWQKINDESPGFNVCMFSENYVWFGGNKGTWKRISLAELH